MATEETSKEKTGAKKSGTKSILFELEHIALDSREVLYEIVKKSLADRDKELSIPMFSRFCLDQSADKFVPDLLDAYDISTRSNNKFLKEIEEGMTDFWESGDIQPRPGFDAFLAKTQKLGFERIALTKLTKKQAGQVLEKLGHSEEGIIVNSYSAEGKSSAGADIWMSAVVDNDLKLGLATAVASSSKACKAALTADLNCVVVVDRFTAFQDFGGASVVADGLEELDIEGLTNTFYQET